MADGGSSGCDVESGMSRPPRSRIHSFKSVNVSSAKRLSSIFMGNERIVDNDGAYRYANSGKHRHVYL